MVKMQADMRGVAEGHLRCRHLDSRLPFEQAAWRDFKWMRVDWGVHDEETTVLVMWPVFLPIFVPVAVNWRVVVHYHAYEHQQPAVRIDRFIGSEKKCVGFVDTTTVRAK